RSIDDSLFVATGIFSDGNRYGLCNRSGNLIKSFFPYPDNNINSVDPKLKATAYSQIIRTHPYKKLFVSAYLDSDWIEICDVEHDEIEKVYSHYTYLPQYSEKRNRQLVLERNQRVGNFYLDVGERYVYIQESPRTFEESFTGE